MELAAAVAFDNLGPLVLGHHALDLEQQIVFGTAPEFPIQEDHLHTEAGQFIDEQHLIGVFARQAVRGMHIEPVHRTGGRQITEALQGRPHQGRATVPIVQKRHRLGEREPVGRDALAQRSDLTGNGVGFGLTIRRHPGIDGCL